ncbi:energy-coupling factor transporter transmembrane protein EcfT [Solirubrobacter ginsenosidimutans]|uniref:Energy-coupling factor transporter transmembrane protein EcfT n=1 Tax=Solirubrobacter ginsenosidimutans TaxID=490573 RepID=A0A9X3MX49_9ACTN|nr:energy-coupling factor transporter transmembrane component T [Solirubrobacter ginsenosidimutans]MDA0161123.1 energy-coupling factor transporter transmembrane protein EcfT [Solirubrobacter ginsenosidimutans]
MTRSPLHATRASVGGAWCLALGAVPICSGHPALLVAVLAAEVIIAFAAGLGPELRATARWGVPFAVVVMAINVLVSRNGATVLFRGPYLPWVGQVDFTFEALVYGAVLGLRILAIFGSAIFLAAAVDTDELLRALRRVSLRSGVTAALALRLFGVLKRDAGRLADAQRCLPDGGASRLQVLHAVTTGALDRATDVAATLEVRGFGAGGRPPRMPRPWSRHDLAFTCSAIVLVGIAAGVVAGLWGEFEAYPRLYAPLNAATAGAIAVLMLSAVLPFADRRGI